MLSARRSSNACSIGRRPRTLTGTEPHPSTRLLRASRAGYGWLSRGCVVLGAVVWLLCASGATGWSAPLQAAPEQAPAAAAPSAQPTAAEHAAPAADAAHGQASEAPHGEGEGESEHGESPWAVVARLVNFAILAGLLVYLLRSPLMGYLEQRGVHVRSELVRATELKKDASAQIAQIDAKMRALPDEIAALTRRGAEEIAAEESRIQAMAEHERRRLLDQAKREIDTQLRVAERELKKRAGELAVTVATERVTRTITDADQARLVERYVQQVRQ
jgi:F-type H+-transporting ATPase subunit b